MDEINKIFTILYWLNIVHDKEEFSVIICNRHKAFMKDMNYKKARPCLNVLIEVKSALMLSAFLLKRSTMRSEQANEKMSGLRSCIELIDQALELYHPSARYTRKETVGNRCL